jgi:hypothetical protein
MPITQEIQCFSTFLPPSEHYGQSAWKSKHTIRLIRIVGIWAKGRLLGRRGGYPVNLPTIRPDSSS